MTVEEATKYIAEHSAVAVKGDSAYYFLECTYYSVDPQGENKHESGAFIAPDGIKCRDSCIAEHQAYKRFILGINIYNYCQDCGDSVDRIYESRYAEGGDEIMCVDRCLSTFNSYDIDEVGRYYCVKCNQQTLNKYMEHYPLQDGEKVVQCVSACDKQLGGYSVNGAILFCTLCSARKMKYPSQVQETEGGYALQQCTATCEGKSKFNSYKVSDYAHGEEGYCVDCDFGAGGSLESLPEDEKDTKCIVCQGSVIHNTSTGAYYCKDCKIYQIATPDYPKMPKIDGNDFECVETCEFSEFTELATQRKYCMDCTGRYLF